ncbi:MAG: nitroreductase [Bacteroidota bacterium]
MQHNLSEINEVIRNRRTIFPEQFSGRQVHRELIDALLENARWAPSHKLTQPWYFKVFAKEGLQRLSAFQADTYAAITPADKFNAIKERKLRERPLMASAVLAVCLRRDPQERVPEVEEVASVAIAVQNMWLTATAYGLGFYWSSGGLTYKPEMKTFLGLAEADSCLGFVYLGYPDVDWPRGQRRPPEYYSDWVEE